MMQYVNTKTHGWWVGEKLQKSHGKTTPRQSHVHSHNGKGLKRGLMVNAKRDQITPACKRMQFLAAHKNHRIRIIEEGGSNEYINAMFAFTSLATNKIYESPSACYIITYIAHISIEEHILRYKNIAKIIRGNLGYLFKT